MSSDLLPKVTRLRYVSAKNKQDIISFLDKLGRRVQIYSIVLENKKWVLWFVPDDRGSDIKSIDL